MKEINDGDSAEKDFDQRGQHGGQLGRRGPQGRGRRGLEGGIRRELGQR